MKDEIVTTGAKRGEKLVYYINSLGVYLFDYSLQGWGLTQNKFVNWKGNPCCWEFGI